MCQLLKIHNFKVIVVFVDSKAISNYITLFRQLLPLETVNSNRIFFRYKSEGVDTECHCTASALT